MRSRTLMNTAALAALMCLGATAANAKALIYCLEGSPENFNPALSTTNTSLDASRHVYNQLVEFEPGTTNLRPGLAHGGGISSLTKSFSAPVPKERGGVVLNTALVGPVRHRCVGRGWRPCAVS